MTFTPHKITMKELTNTDFILGSDAGNRILSIIREVISLVANLKVIEISFEGMRGVDACFIRNSIAAFAKIYCCEIGLFVSNIENIDVMDNLVYGFKAKGMPLIVNNNDGTGAVFGDLHSGAQNVLAFAYKNNGASTKQVANLFNLSVPNASINLKKLFKQGYLIAEKNASNSGGIEFQYSPFFVCYEFTTKV